MVIGLFLIETSYKIRTNKGTITVAMEKSPVKGIVAGCACLGSLLRKLQRGCDCTKAPKIYFFSISFFRLGDAERLSFACEWAAFMIRGMKMCLKS